MLFSLSLAAALAAAIAPCEPPPARRWHCVHDGDTVWWQGEKIRIADIDAPELKGRCEREARLALASRDRLVILLNSGRPPQLRRTGTDRYGRTLARFGGIGDQLIREGLASRWPQRRDWCR